MKKFSSLALALGILTVSSYAIEIQGTLTGYFSSDIEVKQKLNGIETSNKTKSDITPAAGIEFLGFPVGPLMIGGGLGYFGQQKDTGDEDIVARAVPVWGTIGLIGPENWTLCPYGGARVGYPVPAARNETWWNKPVNYYLNGFVGARLPYHVGLEFEASYITMQKWFKKQDLVYNVSSLKFGVSLVGYFTLSGEGRSKPKDNAPEEKKNEGAESMDFSVFNADTSSTANSDPYATDSSTTDPYATDPYATESSASEPATDSAATDPYAADPYATESSASDSSAADPYATEPATDLAADSTATQEPAAEEPAAEEPAAEEVAAEEPAAEPAVEPAPEPEKKPVAKKKPAAKKKAAAKKKPAKKKAKAKKPAKKQAKKGKKKK